LGDLHQQTFSEVEDKPILVKLFTTALYVAPPLDEKALTASPGSEEEKVVGVVRNLWIEQIVWMTKEDEDVAKYIPGIKASWVRVALPQEYEAIRQVIRRMIETTLARLRIDGLSVPEEVNRKVLVGLMNRLRAEIEAGVKGPNMHYMALISAALVSRNPSIVQTVDENGRPIIKVRVEDKAEPIVIRGRLPSSEAVRRFIEEAGRGRKLSRAPLKVKQVNR
jgi:ERCC4-related helicase